MVYISAHADGTAGASGAQGRKLALPLGNLCRLWYDVAMGKFGVREEKERALEARMRDLQIHEEDLEETFVRSSGPGGQHVNKTATCVRLTHRPTGISVKVQQARSQALNRFLARRILADRVEEHTRGAQALRMQEREKIRRQKQHRTRRTKQKLRERPATAEEAEHFPCSNGGSDGKISL